MAGDVSPLLDRFEALLARCVERDATDLHLAAGTVPRLRVHGALRPVDGGEPWSADETAALVDALLADGQRAAFAERRTLDLAWSGRDGTRYRLNAYRERGGTALAVRRLESGFRTFAEWGLPDELGELARLRDGLVLVTGPTGSGKSTTLATLVDGINAERACHVLTIEDPIEYLHANRRALVTQRELHTHVPGFAEAVRAALREDPDVILVGEMRDLDTMRTALTAAETGHLVFSTLHTGDCVGAIERLVGVFPADEQAGVRQQLSLVLRHVVAQRLLRRRDGRGMVPVVERLPVTGAVANLVRSGRTEQIRSVMEAGQGQGMRTMEQELAALVAGGVVDADEARLAARDLGDLETWLARAGGEAAPWR